MRISNEERKRRLREYVAMIRRNNPEEIAEYKRKKEEKHQEILEKYSDRKWINEYVKQRRNNFPSVIKRKEDVKIKREKRLEEKRKRKLDYEIKKEKRLEEKSKNKRNYKEVKKELNKIRCFSTQYCRRHLDKYNADLHEVHHGFGWFSKNFIILLKEDHFKMHKKFGYKNEDCLYTDNEVYYWLKNKPHCVVQNLKIIKNTLF